MWLHVIVTSPTVLTAIPRVQVKTSQSSQPGCYAEGDQINKTQRVLMASLCFNSEEMELQVNWLVSGRLLKGHFQTADDVWDVPFFPSFFSTSCGLDSFWIINTIKWNIVIVYIVYNYRAGVLEKSSCQVTWYLDQLGGLLIATDTLGIMAAEVSWRQINSKSIIPLYRDTSKAIITLVTPLPQFILDLFNCFL